MDMVTAMRIAIEIARHGSFTAASRELRLSAPSVSRIMAELEADLGVRLFNRTTRQLNLTDAGIEFVQKSSGILEELDTMRSVVRERHDTPRGQLRVSCVMAFGNECLAPALPEFLRRFPQLDISLDLGNRLVDLIEEHYDVAIRVGPLSDSSMIAQKIYTQRIIFVASPEFCRRFGMPKSVDEVRSYPSVTQVSGEWGRTHQFRYLGEIIDFEVAQHFRMNSARAVKNACLTGYGYSLLPDFIVADDLAQNRLVQLLPNYEPVEQSIYAFYAQRRHTPQKIRVFIDYLAEVFGS
ncbi:MAG: LysR family transcriptional regulator [Mesorhizobium sp.]|nr:MAG: LysR family transcriptional regulator [Mesorhizobium sp.]RWL05248.1 MAG: LysR family transcriptional regulator [Mesorhizobium sp.]RWO40185.1 MAG: LysR family transcriptional regulator [Mesorhizobium sp.]TIN10271.1 MAG: LysR family transcriptional regulator [Mesorhizobium sp.]TIN23059.1 MAG: LysR family transcriptional regulator [Mesorhizobium sp.]